MIDTVNIVTQYTLIVGCYALIIKFLLSNKSGVSKMDFDKLKETTQYKDNCVEIVKRIEQRADDRHGEIKEGMHRIENLIIQNGNKK